jgi:hypothetical protein
MRISQSEITEHIGEGFNEQFPDHILGGEKIEKVFITKRPPRTQRLTPNPKTPLEPV